MGHTFHATPSEAIIYENSDDNPRSDPFTYRSRVVFYSGFRYPARVGAQLTGTATFASVERAAGYPIVIQAHNCGAHGRPGIPLVEGRWLGIGLNGADVPMVGSVPIYPGQGGDTNFMRWGTLGADATNVYLYSMCFQFPTTTGFVHPQISVGYVIDILDWTLV